MSVAYSPAAIDRSPQRGVAWVLGGAAAMLAIVAWLTVLLHLVLVVRAESRLAEILQEADAFSQLPGVHSRELNDYVQRRLAAAGFRTAQVNLAPRFSDPSRPQVASIETTCGDVGVAGVQPLWQWLGDRPLAVGAPNRARPLPFGTR